MTATKEADKHHLFEAVLEKVFRIAGHLGTAGSAYFQALPSMKTWPAEHPPLCLRLSATSASSSWAAVPWVSNLHHASW